MFAYIQTNKQTHTHTHSENHTLTICYRHNDRPFPIAINTAIGTVVDDWLTVKSVDWLFAVTCLHGKALVEIGKKQTVEAVMKAIHVNVKNVEMKVWDANPEVLVYLQKLHYVVVEDEWMRVKEA